MSTSLLSNTFSSESLRCGLNLVKQEAGMEDLNDKTDQELQEELKYLQEELLDVEAVGWM